MGIEKEDERMYLQFLQNNIARMNTNSCQTKSWCIAIVTALLAIFAETKNFLFALICIVPVILFCILDTLYLQQEHKFVGMYNDYVKGEVAKTGTYKMPIRNYERGVKGFFKAFRSWSIMLIYPTLLFSALLIFLYVKMSCSSAL